MARRTFGKFAPRRKHPPRTPLTKEERAKLKELFDHIIDILNARYGSHDVPLELWQMLCRDVNEPEGSSIKECKDVSFHEMIVKPECKEADDEKLMKAVVFVNIIDFVKTIDITHPEYHTATVVRYPGEQELRDYSNPLRKWFPLCRAKESDILEALLIHMENQ